MTTTYKVLGQANPSANTDTTLYSASSAAVCSTLTICNTGVTSATVRAAVRVANASIETKQYLVYDTSINPTESLFLTLGITVANTDVITVRANTGNVAFGVFGSEIS